MVTNEIDDIIQNIPIYPLRFEPVYKDYLWGGNRFRRLFGRSLPENIQTAAESWEVCDHPHGQSVIQNGPLRGKTLHDLVLGRPNAIFGDLRIDPQSPPARFPLLFKYLDATEPLSIQVHPDDQLAAELELQDRGKTEFWVVVDAEPGSSIWVGTRRPISRKDLSDHILSGQSLEAIMNRIEVQVGDCYLIPPGTPHALGAGVLVAEVQTTSDLTFRLFDWDRVDAEGKPRELKIEEGIRALADPCQSVKSLAPRMSDLSRRRCERLVSTENFTVNRWTLDSPISWKSDRRCHIWTVLEGSVDLLFTAGRRMTTCYETGREADPDAIEVFHPGDTLLVPAVCDLLRWIPENNQPVILLDVIVENVA